jgi:repressor LexA
MNVTPKQLRVLEFIRRFCDTNGYAPTLDEIARVLKVSKVTILQHVRALERRGVIRRGRYQSRSIEIIKTDVAGGTTIPLVGAIAAGAPIEAIEEHEVLDLGELVAGRAEPFMLRVRGDSMIEEQIRDGDFVICERRASARNGETVVAVLPSGDATLKKFFQEPGGRVRLQPANARLSPLYTDRVDIRGVVVGVLRKY